MNEFYYQITYKQMCFGVIVRSNYVIDTAPIARWMINKSWFDMMHYWWKRGATFTEIKTN